MPHLMNRTAVVVQWGDEGQTAVIGPFKHYLTACDRRDQIAMHMEDHTDMMDGSDFHVAAIACFSTNTKNEEIERLLTNA